MNLQEIKEIIKGTTDRRVIVETSKKALEYYKCMSTHLDPDSSAAEHFYKCHSEVSALMRTFSWYNELLKIELDIEHLNNDIESLNCDLQHTDSVLDAIMNKSIYVRDLNKKIQDILSTKESKFQTFKKLIEIGNFIIYVNEDKDTQIVFDKSLENCAPTGIQMHEDSIYKALTKSPKKQMKNKGFFVQSLKFSKETVDYLLDL